MSTEKSELHVTDIERSDKGRWVDIARARKMTLSAWIIEALNKEANEQAVILDRIKRGYYE